jgi:hypothetical protein
LIYLALATVIAQILTGGPYGFHRDELATLDDARHLAWGYVAYPPITPFFARLSLTLFGTSLSGFRFFAALAQAVAVVLTGLMARELGGGRGAQFGNAATAILRPKPSLSWVSPVVFWSDISLHAKLPGILRTPTA